MRIGIYGGSFDPVHYGHLLLAECCREQCHLDRVWFLPAAVPPHKKNRSLAAAKARVEMLELAIAGHDAFRVSTLELDRGGVSYTVDTLQQIKYEQPGSKLFFLMGADSLADLPTWREPQRICQLAIPVVVHRARSAAPDWTSWRGILEPGRLEEIRQHAVTMPIVELASTDIRSRVRRGRSIRYRTPRAVEKYIETNQLYRTPSAASSKDSDA